ncbi:hypothetical protein FRC08_013638 [Ceratobasidium sp. 394]|nr:hypothetical protein FRC08_013638 [Ceratobasidium sp. 394]
MLPLEVFTQIMRNAQPGSLLALARTCKTLRTALLSRSAMDIWQTAERKTPRLPARPHGMSSPQYAALAYFNECSVSLSDAPRPLHLVILIASSAARIETSNCTPNCKFACASLAPYPSRLQSLARSGDSQENYVSD